MDRLDTLFALALVALSLAPTACGSDDTTATPDLGADVSDAGDAGVDAVADTDGDTSDDGANGASPVVTPPAEPVHLEPAGSITLDLRDLVSDPDTTFRSLTITVTSSAHVTATAVAEALTLTAAADFAGTESVGLRAVDPEGHSGSGDLVVRVGDEPVETELSGEPRSCDVVFTWDSAQGAASTVNLAGEFNDWSPTADPLTESGGVFSIARALAPGEYGYKLVLNGDDWREDPTSPYHLDVDAVRNSLVVVDDCAVPLLELVSTEANAAAGRVAWHLTAWDASLAAGLDPESLTLTVNREPVPASAILINESSVTITLTGLDVPGRYTLRGSVADADGRTSVEIYAPAWLEEAPFRWDDAVVYFAFVDRFANGTTANDAPQPADNPLVDWMGGDWAGLLDPIESGYFEDLGVNTLWITAPNDNPDTLMAGTLGDLRTAYHGYFPSAARATENHFGTLADLRAVIDAAHARGLRVLTDFVANHVHETHPYYVNRTGNEFNVQEVCRDIDWVRPITCWFEPYLPDFDYAQRGNVRRTVDDALWWIRAADLDGFRMDAVKHMDQNVGYLLRAEIDRLHAGTGVDFFMIGETFTGLWSESEADLLALYVSPGQLDGQFNFPLYFEIVRTVLRRESGFEWFTNIDNVVGLTEGRFPAPALMGTFAGNHDVPRLTSHAAGQIADMWGNGAQEQALSDPPPQPDTAAPYARAELALTLVLTLPGVPTLYYGDEIGLAGAGDPDNRRFFPPDATLNSFQTALRNRVGALGRLRVARAELRRGDRTTLLVNDVYVFARHLNGAVTLVALNNAPDTRSVDVPVSAWLTDGTTLSELGGGSVSVISGRVAFDVPGTSARVFTSP